VRASGAASGRSRGGESPSLIRAPAQRLAIGLLSACLAVVLWPCPPAPAYTLYGFEDEYGIVHLAETKTSERDVLVYEGPADPRLGFTEIKRLLRQKGGVAAARRQDWIADTVRPYGAFPASGGGPYAFGPVTTSGPLVDMIRRSSAAHRVPMELLYAVVEQESGFQAGAVSPKGAQGLMQLMPDTQATMDVADPFEPEKNIAAGARFLRMMLDRFRETPLALAAYNAGRRSWPERRRRAAHPRDPAVRAADHGQTGHAAGDVRPGREKEGSGRGHATGFRREAASSRTFERKFSTLT
jgi:hypothetical protein